MRILTYICCKDNANNLNMQANPQIQKQINIKNKIKIGVIVSPPILIVVRTK